MKHTKYYVPITHSIGFDALSHPFSLLFGPTRSGKSFMAIHIINMLSQLPITNIRQLQGNATCPTQIFLIDLKNAEMARLQTLLPDGRVATTKDQAINLLEHFIELKRSRADFIANYGNFGDTASKLHMPLFCLVFEEFATTNAVFDEGVTKVDKDMRYKWHSLTKELFLTGAGLGFIALIITQQPTVVNADLSTIITDQVSVKLGMGSMTATQLHLGFGNDIDIPNFHLTQGEGLAWINGYNDEMLTPFKSPYIDPQKMWVVLQKSLTYQDTNKYLLRTMN